jgi:hypothetical protein
VQASRNRERYALAVIVQAPQAELCLRIALVCGLAVPNSSLCEVQRCAEAIGISDPKEVLRKGIALLGSSAVPDSGLPVVLRFAHAIVEARKEIKDRLKSSEKDE